MRIPRRRRAVSRYPFRADIPIPLFPLRQNRSSSSLRVFGPPSSRSFDRSRFLRWNVREPPRLSLRRTRATGTASSMYKLPAWLAASSERKVVRRCRVKSKECRYSDFFFFSFLLFSFSSFFFHTTNQFQTGTHACQFRQLVSLERGDREWEREKTVGWNDSWNLREKRRKICGLSIHGTKIGSSISLNILHWLKCSGSKQVCCKENRRVHATPRRLSPVSRLCPLSHVYYLDAWQWGT